MFENELLRKIFGYNKEEVKEAGGNSRTMSIISFYSSPDVARTNIPRI
jgi:hypothetical protein